MLLSADYHTHTHFSDGHNTVLDNARVAKEKGLMEVAISDHGFGRLTKGLSRKNVEKLREEARYAEKEIGIKVLLGIEANLLGKSGKCDLKESDYEKFDVFLCGYHLLVAVDKPSDFFQMLVRNSLNVKPSEGIIRRNTRTYLYAIKNNPIDSITHLSYRFPCDALEVAKCAADYGTYIELNAKKTHLSDEELTEIVQKTSARFLVNSDAHTAVRVGDKRIVEEQLKRVAFPLDRIDNIDGRLPTFRFTEYKNRRL